MLCVELSGVELLKMDINILRYRNARTLIYDVGSLRKIANAMQLPESKLNEYIGLNPNKVIDDHFAELLEKAVGKPCGWLDQLNSPKLLRANF